MKKIITLLAVAAVTSSGFAGILFNEDFSYSDGPLTTGSAGVWVNHSGAVEEIMVSSGAIQIGDFGSEDAHRDFGSVISSGSVYASFEFSVTAAAPVGGSDFEYFAHFGNGSFAYRARLDVVAPSGGGDFSLGLGQTSTAELTWGSDLTFGTTYTGVLGFNADTGISSLWIDPTSMASSSISTSASLADPGVDGFYIRQAGSSANETITLDNLVVGTAFSDVVVVPEPSTIAAILGLFALGFVAYRRRK